MSEEITQAEITRMQRAIRGAKDNAEVGAGSVAVILAGVAETYGVPVSAEMVAAGSGLLVAVGQRLKEALR